MIKSCHLNYSSERFRLPIDDSVASKYEFDVPDYEGYFYYEIVLNEPVKHIRDHSYRWCGLNKEHITSSFSPLILQLISGCFVQATRLTGYWRVNPKRPHVLIWEFNPEYSRPLTQYRPPQNFKNIVNSTSQLSSKKLGLLFSIHGGIELSRSKIPFSGILCFTDHCDFDNLMNLKTQREFFKKHGIKVTKGFFLNNFSNRINASWEEHQEELELWYNDGHELAYHSLSQSIKTVKESFSDFKNFKSPNPKINVWIDHGFQPYNHSLYRSFNISETTYASLLQQRHIDTLWNYVDSGTITLGVINQLNPLHFTLNRYWNGVKKEGLKHGVARLFKAVFFHYINNDRYIFVYKQLAQEVKKLIYGKKLGATLAIIKLSVSLIGLVLKNLFRWPVIKERVFPLARYTPLYFNHVIDGVKFKVFQTIEMIDFKYGLSKSNLDMLIDEAGICIGHTYFSVPLTYHTGKLLDTDEQINQEVDLNFAYLAYLIKNNRIWNPILSELLDQLELLNICEFDIDQENNIYLKQAAGINYRSVTT